MTSSGLLWLLLDGLSHTLYQRLAPWLEVDVKRVLALDPLTPNCQTPPSLFSIWSGLGARAHRLTGYDMPADGTDDPLATRDAFKCWPKDVSMVWDQWAAAGGRIRTCAIPFVQSDRLGAALLSHTEVYSASLIPPRVLAPGDDLVCPELQVNWRVAARGAGIRVNGAFPGSVDVAFGSTAHIELPPGLTAAVAGETHRAIAVHAERIAGQPRLCVLGFQPVTVQGCEAALRREAMHARVYCAGNPAKLYATGALGQRMGEGGGGEAEHLLLELLESVHRSFLDDILWAVEAGGADLIIGYYPVIDLMSHQLLHHVAAPESETQHALAQTIMRRLAAWLRDILLGCRSRLASGFRLVAHSDHGMSPLRHDVNPNQCFAARGWLAVDEDGRIDPARSLAFYHPAENGWLALHPLRMATASLQPQLLAQALNQRLAGELGGEFRLLRGPAASAGLGWESPWYLQPPRGVRLRSGMHAPLVARSSKGGDHTCWSDDPWLQGVLLEPDPPDWSAAWKAPVQLTDLAPALMRGLGRPTAHSSTPPCL